MLLSVSAVLLAAGASRRMGRPKQLLPVNGTPAVRRCAETVLEAGLRDVVVVTGAYAPEVEEALRGLPVRIVRNELPDAEMIDSVRTGLQGTAPAAPAVLLCLADHPLVLPQTVRIIVQEHATRPDSIIIPVHEGRRGHPSLFPRALTDSILAGRTLRDVIRARSDRLHLLPVNDIGVVLDMDTQDDYAAASRAASDRS